MTGGPDNAERGVSTYRGAARLFNQQKVTEMYSRLVYKKMAAISARDNSFTEQPTFIERLFGLHKISRDEVRQIYLRGIQTGLEEGIRMVRLEGQMMMLNESAETRLQKEFLQKFHELCAKYNYSIQWHLDNGLCVVDRNYSGGFKVTGPAYVMIPPITA